MQRSRKIGFAASIALVAVIAASLLVGVSKVGATCLPSHCWQLVSSPNAGSYNNFLNGVYALTSNDVWAVGNYLKNGTLAQTLIENWDGTSWSIVSSPNQGTSYNNYLNGIGFAHNDLFASSIWAVGYYVNSAGHKQTLIEQYNGAPASWSVVSSPDQTTNTDNVLTGVSGSKENDYWAVGYYYDSTAGGNRTLIEHWNGTSWSIVSSPNPGTGTRNDVLASVSSVVTSTAWAVGSYVGGGLNTPVVLKWNGTQWNDDGSNLPSGASGSLSSVSFVDSVSGWTVGADNRQAGASFQRDQNGWHNGSLNEAQMSGVDYEGASSAWAVGTYYGLPPHSTSDYWDGSSWTHYSPAGSGAVNGELFNAVNGVSNTDTWAAGYSINSSGVANTYIEHYH